MSHNMNCFPDVATAAHKPSVTAEEKNQREDQDVKEEQEKVKRIRNNWHNFHLKCIKKTKQKESPSIVLLQPQPTCSYFLFLKLTRYSVC